MPEGGTANGAGRSGGVVMRALPGLMLVLLLGGCGTQVDRPASYGCRHSSPTSTRSAGRPVLTPAVPKPGQRFLVTFATRKERGTNLVLSRIGPDDCHREFVVYDDGAVPRWMEIPRNGEYSTVDEMHPRRVVRGVWPPPARAGVYQLCTEHTQECVYVTLPR